MKKMVKLLSVVLLISMMFSMMAAGASAIVDTAPSQGGIVLGGPSSVGVSDSGNMVIGADQRPEDDSPFMGVRVEDIESGAANAASYGVSLSSSERLSIINDLLAELEKQEEYNGQFDSYPGIDDSADVNVQLNKDFLMYIRDNTDSLKTTENGQKTLKTAIELFGEDAVYGPTPDLTALTAEYNDLQDQILNMRAAFNAAQAAAQEEAPETEIPEAEAPEAEAAPTEDAQAVEGDGAEANFDVLAAETSFGAGYANIDEVPEYQAAKARFMEVAAELRKYGALPGLLGAQITDANKIKSNWSDISSQGSSLASAVAGGGTVVFDKGNSFDICNSTDYRITINLNGATIDATGCPAAFTIQNGTYGGTITFTNGTINGDGFYVFNGGVLNLGGLINTSLIDITVNAKTNAVYVDDTGTAVCGQGTTLNGGIDTVRVNKGGAFLMTGGTINGGSESAIYACDTEGNGKDGSGNPRKATVEITGSTAEVINKNDNGKAVAIQGSSNSQITVKAGTIYGPSGITVSGAGTTLDITGGNITGFTRKIGLTYPSTGAAITFYGDNASKADGTVPLVYAFGGTLRSEYTAAVIALTSSGTRYTTSNPRSSIKAISVDTVNVTVQEAAGEESDYAQAVALVNKIGYASLDEAIAAANALSATENATITLLDDCEASSTAIAAGKFNITFDGNGHTIKADSKDGISVAASTGKVDIKNVTIHATTCDKSGIAVTGKANVGIYDVTVDHCAYGLYVMGADANVTVNGFNVDNSTKNGFHCDNGKTTVVMCKIDCDTPVDAATKAAALKINGGWFLHKEDMNEPDETKRTQVSTFVDPDVSYVKYVEKDRYYEVLYNDTPTVEIKAGATGYEADGTPYVKYDKADPDPIIFTVTPAVKRITAVSKTDSKLSYPLFTAEKGKSGDIRIPDNEVLMDCLSGAYDLEFEFMNGYTIKDKLSLYVFPKTALLFKVPNILELSPSVGAGAAEKNNGNIVDYLIKDNLTDKYSVGENENIAVVMSELPDRITIGNVADGSAETSLENYIYDFKAGDRTTWGVVPSGPYAGDYFYFISYADLNNLASGQNYVFLEWDGVDGALKRLPLTLKNSAVSISPTELDWSKIDSFANFTVKPSVDTVYVDGEKVDEAYWDYNTDNHVLSIKGSFLKALENKEHNIEVITPLGKVNATLNTGIGLRAKNIDYHVYGGAKALSFVTSDKINKEAGIWIGSSNPTKLDPSAYTWDSDTGFTLSPAFLNRLALGTYYISCYVYNGTEYEYTTTTFKVISASQASYTPSTGDNSNIVVWLVILVLSAVAIVVIILPRLKKGKMGK